ncbi:hypothetical protein B7R54_02590 [Subtercola boreus]|uniref:Luciferase-like domain-containing protein n=1 Tax=Subtercola boreus TaxID=120213 RepID=A0A3E0VE85_9MICO|nr:LLM class flavin-dependent oxidoreductase [Subtercola boreus]RFA08234.1 hypothetical protein B7R54_02590 [Subtercola boreus]TQL54872.1 alkanesulfonate monooxygenase SsuD/methylene tetrahydromethanopterin reductase-like flavin-dependent oxidoreductase (luciferase family) [Subtercola boreus]
MTTQPLGLGWLTTFAAPTGPTGPNAARPAAADDWADGSAHVSLARQLERAGFDFVIVDDEAPGDRPDGRPRTAADGEGARHDSFPLVGLLGSVTSRLRIVGSTSTGTLAPYHVARSLATLDNLLGGRVGWNARLENGPDALERAVEFSQVMKALWASWQPGSLVLDAEAPLFADFTKVLPIDHRGRHFASRGPLNALPPVRTPLITVTQQTPDARAFAARCADVLVLTAEADDLPARVANVRLAVSDSGRDPVELEVLLGVHPVLADTRADAEARSAREAGHPGVGAAVRLGLVGTPAEVAERLHALRDETGNDGFVIVGPADRRYVAEIAEGLVPALDRLAAAEPVAALDPKEPLHV